MEVTQKIVVKYIAKKVYKYAYVTRAISYHDLHIYMYFNLKLACPNAFVL
jgi:hypothetical protein